MLKAGIGLVLAVAFAVIACSQLEQYNAKLLAVGTKAPGVKLSTPTGKHFDLAKNKGSKATIVNFWFST